MVEWLPVLKSYRLKNKELLPTSKRNDGRVKTIYKNHQLKTVEN